MILAPSGQTSRSRNRHNPNVFDSSQENIELGETHISIQKIHVKLISVRSTVLLANLVVSQEIVNVESPMSATATDDVTSQIETLVGKNWLNLAQAARLFPGPKPPSPATVGRFMAKGSRGVDGQRIKLQGIRSGSRWFTTAEYITAFLKALSDGVEPETQPTPRTAGQITRAAEKAGAELERIGI